MPVKRNSISKVLTVCAVGMTVGFGTCGIGVLVGNSPVIRYVATGGSILFFVSLAGFVITLLVKLFRRGEE